MKHSEDDYKVYNVYTINLTSQMGLTRLSRYVVNPQPFYNREIFKPEFIKPVTSGERRAMFHWIVGHHLLFIQWELMTECCNQAAVALEEQRFSAALFWLNRATTITKASIAAMEFSGDFSPDLYKDFIRPAMTRVREDFAGGSSLDYYRYSLAVKNLGATFAQTNMATELSAIAEAMQALKEAGHAWFKRHIAVAENLQPDMDSLLQKEIRNIAQSGQKVSREKYMNEIIRSPDAQHDYDTFFGVTRPEVMFIEDFNHFLDYTLNAVNKTLRFSSLTLESRKWLKAGEIVMREIAEEAIDPEGRLRAA